MTDETANLVGQLTQGYREHKEAEPEITAVPGRVIGSDIEGQADALADDASRLAALLAAFAREPGPAVDRCDRGVPRPEPGGRVDGRGRRGDAPPGMA